jgi:hypothetical protein
MSINFNTKKLFFFIFRPWFERAQTMEKPEKKIILAHGPIENGPMGHGLWAPDSPPH